MPRGFVLPKPGHGTVKSIAATLTGNVGLKELDLSWNNLRQGSAAAIGRALSQNRGLRSLSLAHNGFNEGPSQELGDSLRSNSVLQVRMGDRCGSLGGVAGERCWRGGFRAPKFLPYPEESVLRGEMTRRGPPFLFLTAPINTGNESFPWDPAL